MSDTRKNDDELVVLAGSITVKRQVGAGMAYVDVAQGEAVGDLDDETRERLLQAKAIGPRDGAPYVAVARPVPGEVEPDEIDTDVIPGGSTEQILAWVGEDLARARVAVHEEEAKGNHARAGLIDDLHQVMAGLETDPPTVPEHLPTDGIAVVAGGVAIPNPSPTPAPGEEPEPAAPAKKAAAAKK